MVSWLGPKGLNICFGLRDLLGGDKEAFLSLGHLSNAQIFDVGSLGLTLFIGFIYFYIFIGFNSFLSTWDHKTQKKTKEKYWFTLRIKVSFSSEGLKLTIESYLVKETKMYTNHDLGERAPKMEHQAEEFFSDCLESS